MRFELSYNTPSKIMLGLLGVGPGKAYVQVDDDTVHARLGWAGSVTIPRENIASVERVDRIPWWLGYGMHGSLRGTWAINGSGGEGAVKLTLNEQSSGKVIGMPVRAHTVYLSLEKPDRFVASVTPKRT